MRKKIVPIIIVSITVAIIIGLSYQRWRVFEADYHVNVYVYYAQEESVTISSPLVLSDTQIEQLGILPIENYDTLTIYADSYNAAVQATERILMVETVKNNHTFTDYLTGCSAETVWDSLVTGNGMFRLYLEHALGSKQRDLDLYYYPVVREKQVQLKENGEWNVYHSAIQAELWASIALDGLTEAGAPARIKQQENRSMIVVSSRNYLDDDELRSIARENQAKQVTTTEKWW